MVSYWNLCVHLSVCHMYVHLSVFSLQDDNLSKYQWIFTKLYMCIDIVEIRFGIANGQISSIFCSLGLCPQRAYGVTQSFVSASVLA